jgi:hypothetical protein
MVVAAIHELPLQPYDLIPLREIAYYIVFLDLPPERCSADAELLRDLALVAAGLNQ